MPKPKVTALCNQKGGVTKTTTTANLGWPNYDALPVTLAGVMEHIIRDEEFDPRTPILSHAEGVDLLPSGIELSGMEVTLVNAMSRKFVLREKNHPL